MCTMTDQREIPADPIAHDPSWQRYRSDKIDAPEMTYETDTSGIIRWASASSAALLGWSPEQLVGTRAVDLIHPLDLDRVNAIRESLYSEGREYAQLPCLFRTSDGTYRSVTVRARPLVDADQAVIGSIVQLTDTHDRDSVLRALTTLSQANRALVRATDEVMLLQQTCETIVTAGRYLFAWYGRPIDDPRKTVQPIAQAGLSDGYLDEVHISWGDNEHGRGPTGMSVRLRETRIANNPENDPNFSPWIEQATRRGFRSSISLPVIVEGELDGVLVVYAAEPQAFTTLTQDLLEDLAADLGYGLHRLRDIEALTRTTQEAIRDSERLQAIFDSQFDPLTLMESVRDDAGNLIDLRYVEANAAAIAYNGIPREQLIGARLLELLPAMKTEGLLAHYFHAIETGTPVVLDDFAYDHELVGEQRRFDLRAAKSGDGLAVTWRDITDRHAAAANLVESEQRFRLLAENSSDVIMLGGTDLTVTWVSPSVEQTFGYPPQSVLGRRSDFLIHPDDLSAVVAELVRTDAAHTNLHMRHRAVRADGQVIWVDVVAGHIDDDGTGKPGRVVSIRDIDAQVRAEQELAARELRYRLLAENSSDVVMVGRPDPTTRSLELAWVSPAVKTTFGLEPEAMIGHQAIDFIHPDDIPSLVRGIDASHSSDGVTRLRYRWRCGDGGYRWVETVGRPVDDDGTGAPARILSLRDVDAEVQAQHELEAREAQYRLLAENASDVIILLDSSMVITWVSPSVEATLGHSPQQLIGLTSADLIHPDDLPNLVTTITESELTRLPLVARYRFRTAAGAFRWVESVGRSAVDEHSGERYRIIAIRDVEEQVTARQQLEHALGHDQLTGLPTRPTMILRIEALLPELPRFHVAGVLCIGIDGLSEVNEALTHSAGDLLLTTIAARIVSTAPGTELVGRGSGNELVVILPVLRTGADAGGIAETIRVAAQGQVTVSGHDLTPTISVGIATGGQDVDPEQLLRDASLALRKAKDNGRNRYEFADPGLAIEAQHRLSLDAEIRSGLENGAFVPWFQPIVSLDNQRVVGYEALVRWIKPGGEAQPLSFLNVAERSALIFEIDLTVLNQSVATLATLPEHVFVAVNVSVATLSRAPYAEGVIHALTRNRIDPSRLHIEVTETMLLDPTDELIDTISRLAALGVKWYIDDFGTGYASITSLRDLSMSGIKLDRSFTYGISNQDTTSMQLAQALVGLANGLHLDTVAEGVETQSQADYLRGLGWRHAQGWLFGKAEPLPGS